MSPAVRRSAGLLLWRRAVPAPGVELLLAHMGGPFWARRDDRAWSIPKGEIEPDAGDDDDQAFATALREFTEELGQQPPSIVIDEFVDLGWFRQSSKSVRVWAIEADLDPATCVSNLFEIEWPPRSGNVASFPEIDRVEWTAPDVARRRLVAGQVGAVDALLARRDGGLSSI